MPTKNKNIEFMMAPKLLFDVICKQAGTLAKAVIEGVMNSVDAGATECHISLTSHELKISDNGRGIRSAKEVREFFGTFGTPHTEEENKVYGTFRMGRGQLFSFGSNVWHTGGHKLYVDIHRSIHETGKISYDMERAPNIVGCVIDIDLYKELSSWAVEDTVAEITRSCRYVPNISVHVNGKLISIDPDTEDNWDLITDGMYLRLRETGPLSVYSKGVFVMEKSSYVVGSGGDVVSTKGFNLNFARNSVLEYECGEWRRVIEMIREVVNKKAAANSRLTSAAKQRYCKELNTYKHSSSHVQKLKILTTVKGTSYTVKRMFEMLKSKFNHTLSVAPKGCPLGDKVMQRGLAFVLSKECVDNLGGDLLEASIKCSLAMKNLDPTTYKILDVSETDTVSVEDILGDVEYGEWEEKDVGKAKVDVRTWIKLLDEFSRTQECNNLVTSVAETRPHRTILLGNHFAGALAWTDGEYRIHFDENYLQSLSLANIKDNVKAAATLWHEFVHGSPDSDTHVHGEEFYERFHDGAEDFIGEFLSYRRKNMSRILGTMVRRETKRMARERLHAEKVLEEAEDFEAKYVLR